MIYYLLRFYSLLGLWFNFRKIYVEHRERVPKGRNVIYGLNHPTAFLDPIILGAHVLEECWFILRGDKFINKPVSWFLHQIKNLPIYREGDEARAGVKGNLATMDFASSKVVEGEPTVILSEGVCRHERRLRPIQRGTARLMFQAWKKDKSKAVAIVPTAINYTASNDFRSSVTITFAEPIYASDYAQALQTDARQTIDAVTEELHRRLRELVIHVADRNREPLAEKLLPLIQHNCPDRGIWPMSHSSPFTALQWQAIESLNALPDFEASQLETELDAYLVELSQLEIEDSGVAFPSYASLSRGLLLWLVGIFAMIGWIINFPIAAIVQRRTDMMVSNPQFYSSVRWGLGLGAFLLYSLIWGIILAFFFGWFALFTPLVFAGFGYGYLQHRDAFLLWKAAAKTKSISKAQLETLRKQRADILARVGLFSDDLLATHA